MVLLSLVFFGVGAILAAVAHGSMVLMLVGRSTQDVGGGGVLVLTEIVVTDLVPLRFRGNWFSMIGSMWAVGSVSGPLVGGAFAGKNLWRWIFWINLPFIGVGAPLVILFLKSNFKQTSLALQLRRVDWIGVFLFIGSTTGFLIPLTWGGVQEPWTSWRTLVPLLVSAAGLVAFVIWEEKFASDPLIRIRVMKNRTMAITYLGDFLQGLLLWCNLYYMPLYFQADLGASPIMAAMYLMPGTLTVAPTAIIVGVTVGKLGRYRWAIWAGWVLVVFHAQIPTAVWVVVNLITGIGLGMLYPSLTFAVQAAVPNEDQAYGVSLFTFFGAAGQCVGVAVGGSIFRNSIKREIAKRTIIAAHADERSTEASSLIEMIKRMTQGPVKTALQESFADALIVVWIVTATLSAVALVSSLWTEHYSLDRALETDHGFQHSEKVGDAREGEKA